MLDPMFGQKTIENHCSRIKPTTKQKKAATEWLDMLKKNKFASENESSLYFGDMILQDILGYDKKHIIPEQRSNKKDRMDYMIIDSDNNPIICLERKGQAKDLRTLQTNYPEDKNTPIRQTYEYQSTKNSKYGICTNHEIFMLLDKDYMLTKVHEFNFLSIEDNPDKLKEFIGIFSKSNLVDNDLSILYEKSEKEQKNVADEFYGIFHETRLMLVDTFKKNGLNNRIAVEFAQIVLNRIIFFFFVADKGMVTNSTSDSDMFYNMMNEQLSTKPTVNSKRVWDCLIDDLFKPLNDGSDPKIFGFNGGLFSGNVPTNARFNDLDDSKFLKDIEKVVNTKHPANERIKKLLQSIEKLNPIIRNLLIMDSYDFKNEISVNILGHIFEQSVSVLEKMLKGDDDSRKNKGVFYTPEFITKYICNNTIIPYLSKSGVNDTYDLVNEYIDDDDLQTLEQKLKEIKILDPACGSGAFLIQAANTLMDIHKAIQDHKKLSNRNGKEKIEDWVEETHIRNIIVNNVYGIDISSRSVDIAKLSIFLKITLNETKLPKLGKNVMVGDSLLPANNIVPVEGSFDWHEKFPEIMRSGGFDIVIGNPPYVRQEKLGADYKKKINIPDRKLSAKQDLSGYFYFRSLQYMKSGGILGFISSETWMMAEYGRPIQKLFLENEILSIIRPTFKVFEDADTTPAIFLLRKNRVEGKKNRVRLATVDNESDMLHDENDMIRIQDDFKIERWNCYFDEEEITVKIPMKKMSEAGTVKRGVVTGYVPFFVLSKEKIKEFSIDEKYQRSLVPDQLPSGMLESGLEEEYLLNVNDTKAQLQKSKEGKQILKYIEHGENIIITPKRGSDRTSKPLHKQPTMINRKIWYSLKLDTKYSMFLSRLIYDYPKIYENGPGEMFQSINTFMSFIPHNTNFTHAFLAYFSSSMFALYLENNGNPMGGGVLSIEVANYKNTMVPDFEKMPDSDIKTLTKAWLNFKDMNDRDSLDEKVFKVLGFTKDEATDIIKELELVRKKRINRPKKKKNES